jgi:hypothetical protein
MIYRDIPGSTFFPHAAPHTQKVPRMLITRWRPGIPGSMSIHDIALSYNIERTGSNAKKPA